MKIYNSAIENRTRDLTASCSAVPKPTALLLYRVPLPPPPPVLLLAGRNENVLLNGKQESKARNFSGNATEAFKEERRENHLYNLYRACLLRGAWKC
jgi:hypothetical protein